MEGVPLFLSSPVSREPFLQRVRINPTPKGKKKERENPEVEREVQKLRQIDQKVRAHELAHMAVGGPYAGTPHYTYVRGPDGRLYAVAGEVPIDVSEEKDPEQTVKKMERVIAAALAPADPSPQDYKVAALASQKLAKALMELAKKRAAELYGKEKDKSLPYLDREITLNPKRVGKSQKTFGEGGNKSLQNVEKNY